MPIGDVDHPGTVCLFGAPGETRTVRTASCPLDRMASTARLSHLYLWDSHRLVW